MDSWSGIFRAVSAGERWCSNEATQFSRVDEQQCESGTTEIQQGQGEAVSSRRSLDERVAFHAGFSTVLSAHVGDTMRGVMHMH